MATSNRKLADLLSEESFVRWIKGRASDPEKQRWEAWEQKSQANRELKASAEMFCQMRMELDAAEDKETSLASLNQRIDRSEKETEEAQTFQAIPSIRSNTGYRIAVAAAIALLVSVVGVLYLYFPQSSPGKADEPLFTTVEVGYGETSSLKFSDGSTIRLNAQSSLRYSLEQFSSERVEVWLEGEGYFDITPNPQGDKREFIVHAPNGKVRVLGTKFNVNTRFQKTSVVLEEGRVEVLRTDSLRTEMPGKIMEPGQRAIITASSSDIVLQKVDVGVFTSWINGEMELYDTSLNDIISSIEVTYGVTIDVEAPELLKRQISGTIQNLDLQNLLSGLQEILDLQIQQIDNKEFLIRKQSIQND